MKPEAPTSAHGLRRWSDYGARTNRIDIGSAQLDAVSCRCVCRCPVCALVCVRQTEPLENP